MPDGGGKKTEGMDARGSDLSRVKQRRARLVAESADLSG